MELLLPLRQLVFGPHGGKLIAALGLAVAAEAWHSAFQIVGQAKVGRSALAAVAIALAVFSVYGKGWPHCGKDALEHQRL